MKTNTTSTTMNRTATHYHILSDGTVASSRWEKQPGEQYQKPGTNIFLTIKYCLTNAEYTICTENSRTIVSKFHVKKTQILRERTGWNSVSKKRIVEELFREVTADGEPLMKESFLISMIHFV